MGADEHVDRVDLQKADSSEDAPDVAEVDPSGGLRVGEPLRGECDAAF